MIGSREPCWMWEMTVGFEIDRSENTMARCEIDNRIYKTHQIWRRRGRRRRESGSAGGVLWTSTERRNKTNEVRTIVVKYEMMTAMVVGYAFFWVWSPSLFLGAISRFSDVFASFLGWWRRQRLWWQGQHSGWVWWLVRRLRKMVWVGQNYPLFFC